MLEPLQTVKIFQCQPEQIFRTGEVIFRDGEKGHIMYGVMEGEVEMWIENRLIEVIQSGDVFGQGALIHEDHSRASTAIAKTDCKLACLNRERFLFAVQETPVFALELMRSYSNRYRRLKRLMDCVDNM